MIKTNVDLYSFKIKLIFYLLLTALSFYINYYFANKGLFPIDTFTFFDSGYLITKGYHPIRDFWVISGIVVDYFQAIFFKIFGANWNAYVFHASILNSSISIFFFFFLNHFIKNFYVNFLLSLSLAILCYPVSGTPFPYQHSYILSLFSILIFYLAIRKEEKKYWLFLPIFMFLSFFSMQMPSGLINLLIIFFILLYFFFIKKKFIIFFLIGLLVSLLILIIYFLIIKVNVNDFIVQLFLFPLTIGEGRLTGGTDAFESAKLLNKLTIRGTLGHFKFINIFVITNLILIILYIKNKKILIDEKIILNIFILLCCMSFIFHQLITANQTFIFSLVPIMCGFFIIQLEDSFEIINKKKINFILLTFILLVTLKYNEVYNQKRKFMDLQNVNLENSINASTLNKKFNNLKWITPFHYKDNPDKELKLLSEAVVFISNFNSETFGLITHYQFFSLILQKQINIFNRWYFPQNNTFPSSKENKYYSFYVERINRFISEKKIEKIFIVESIPGEFDFINFEDLLKGKCFFKEKYNDMLYSINLKNCN